MRLERYAYILKNRIELLLLRARAAVSTSERFECPVCEYRGPFANLKPSTGLRRHAKCPGCGALERHRLQYLAFQEILHTRDTANMRMLHFAPEPFFRPLFSARFGRYETADLNMKDVDHKLDIQCLPFEDASCDVVFASHVLDYVQDDKRAIAEIRRVLKPNGIAVLPVAVVCEATVEYERPNPNESHQVRASGMDYMKRYEAFFSRVENIVSTSFPDRYQLFVYEDRSAWPNERCPLRTATLGEKHMNVVPICHV